VVLPEGDEMREPAVTPLTAPVAFGFVARPGACH
jgi:hypothetical protein